MLCAAAARATNQAIPQRFHIAFHLWTAELVSCRGVEDVEDLF